MVTNYNGQGSILNWLDIIQIVLLLLACYLCYLAGKFNGVQSVISLLLDKDIITEKDLDRLTD